MKINHIYSPRKSSVVISVFIAVLFLVAYNANAEENKKLKSWNPGVYAKGSSAMYDEKDGSYTYTYYRIAVNAPGYLNIVNNKGTDSVYIYYGRTSLHENAPYEYWHLNREAKKTKVPVDKGTYYVLISGISSSRVKYSYTRGVFKKNYRPASALRLKAKQKVTIIQTPEYSYYRWYKFQVKKKKKLHIKTNDPEAVAVYRVQASSFKKIDSKLITPGDYYISVDNTHSAIITLKWF